MRKLTGMAAAAVVLALTACGSSDKSGGNGSAAASGGGAGVSLQPGEWEMKIEVVKVSGEGIPAAAIESMKQSAAKTERTCMTAEEAKGPKADQFAPNPPGASCKSEGYSWANGRISGKTRCTAAGGVTSEVVMDGKYDPQSMDMTMKSDTAVAGRTMATEMRISGHRVGECPAGKAG